jgi:hypothetical protein
MHWSELPMTDRDTLAREMMKVVPAPFTPRAIETAMRHIQAARAEALGEAAMACNKIHSRYSLTGNAEQVSAWVTSNECENAIRSLAQSAAPDANGGGK